MSARDFVSICLLDGVQVDVLNSVSRNGDLLVLISAPTEDRARDVAVGVCDLAHGATFVEPQADDGYRRSWSTQVRLPGTRWSMQDVINEMAETGA